MDPYTFAENKLLKSHKLIMDTSSVMELTSLSAFVDTYSHILLMKRIVILPSVYSELIKHKFSADEHKQKVASVALQYLQEHGQYFSLPDTLSCNTNYFADADILEYLLSARTDFVTLLITQDRNLAKDAMAMNGISSCYGRKIFACRLDGYGFFKTFTFDSPQQNIESATIRVVDTEKHDNSEAVSPLQQKTHDQGKSDFSCKDFAFGVVLGAVLLPIGKRLIRLLRSGKNGS